MSNWSKFIVAADVHGDMQDAPSVKAFHAFTKLWKPRLRILAGDVWDFRPLRRKANEDERRESLQADFKAGMSFIDDFQPHYFQRGNHDERLWELAERANGVASDYALQGIGEISEVLDEIKCRMLPYHKRDGILKIGHLKILHGFHSGIYASRQTALIYGSCLFGHIHTVDEHSIPGLERRVARSIGCLCALDQEYNARQTLTLRQAHGFAYGILNEKTGDYRVWQGEEINGQWILPTDTVTL